MEQTNEIKAETREEVWDFGLTEAFKEMEKDISELNFDLSF